MEFVTQLAGLAILATTALLWATWSKLDIGLSKPAFRRSELWVLLFILWTTAESAITIFLPVDVDSDWLAHMAQLSLLEDLTISVLIAPVSEELLFRGAMFAAFLRHWGIWPAAVIPSIIWGLFHLQYEWWLVASIIGSGVLLAMVRSTSGSIYLCVVLHATWNLLVTLNNRGLFGSVA